jgi:murein DD-endopeptidase MepM/ murein hydrolase activator NlpD
MFLQIAICLVIYFIFYLIQNSNYIFSESVISKVKEILSYDVDIVSVYEQVTHFFSEQIDSLNADEENKNINENTEQENGAQVNEEQENAVEENGIGGADIENVTTEETSSLTTNENAEDTETVTASADIEETDEEYIKNHYSLIKPINGIVSSEFGQRNVDNPIVSKNHTGIDIAANTGTVIKAAMDGTVTISSTVGDYGYHIKIENDGISTLYAHCSKLYVKKGDIVVQGQEIGEVGSTGKSTGPHLHFEIMRGSTYINPRSILDF